MTTETIKIMKQHRSIRKFSTGKIADSDLQEIILAAQAASTSSFQQCVSIVHVTDKVKREKLVGLTGEQQYVALASDFFVFCADFSRHHDISPDAKLGFVEQLLTASIDAGMMGENALVAAESMGLGGVFIGGIRNNPTVVCQLLELPEHVYPLFGLCLGFPDDNPDLKPRMPCAMLIHEDVYQPLNLQALDDYDSMIKQYYEHRNDHNKHITWSGVVKQKVTKEARPFLLDTLHKQGFAKR